MLRAQFFLLAAWFGIMTAVVGTSIAMGVPVTSAGMAGWVVLGFIPPIALMTVFRGAGAPTMSQVIADVTTAPAPIAVVRHDVVDR